MGCDIHTTLGRLNFAAIEKRTSTGSELTLFAGRRVEYEDFTLANLPDEVDLNRNYGLFSFLAGVRGSVKPLFSTEQMDKIKSATHEFVAWLDQKMIAQYRAEKKAGVPPSLHYHGYEPDMDSVFDIGDHNRMVHLISILRQFDYDQAIEREDDENPDFDYENPTFIKDIGGETYRDWFGEGYFKLLDYCERENWHFLIIGFDS